VLQHGLEMQIGRKLQAQGEGAEDSSAQAK